MIAFLCCHETTTGQSPWGAGRDTCLLRVVDRPMLQHVLETLADHGVTALQVLQPCVDPDRSELLGDGARWGMKITCWREGIDETNMFASLGDDLKTTGEGLIVAIADCLPHFPVESSLCESIWIAGEKTKREHRWLLLTQEDAVLFAKSNGLPPMRGIRQVAAPAWLDTATPESLLESQQALLDGVFPISPLFGSEVERGIWIGRKAAIHPSAKLYPPVFIGSFARIARDAVIGPFAAVGSRSVVGNGTIVERAMIDNDTLVGEHLFLHGSVLLGQELYDTRHAVQVTIADPVLVEGEAKG